MRPKERLLRRGIPKTEIINGLEKWSESLTRWERGYTIGVAIGLLIELTFPFARYLPHTLFDSIWPHAFAYNAIANVMVFGGVVGELVISSRSSRVETDLRDENAKIIAALNAETERLRKENNDTIIMRSFRSLGDVTAFEAAMSPFPGTRFFIEHALDATGEIGQLQGQLSRSLPAAGWFQTKIAVAELTRMIPSCVSVFTVSHPDKPRNSAAALALARWLDGNFVAVRVSPIAWPETSLGTLFIQIGSRPESIELYEKFRQGFAEHRPVTPSKA